MKHLPLAALAFLTSLTVRAADDSKAPHGSPELQTQPSQAPAKHSAHSKNASATNSQRCVAIGLAGVVVIALKPSDDGKALIVRLFGRFFYPPAASA